MQEQRLACVRDRGMAEGLAQALSHYTLGELRSCQRVKSGNVDENWIVGSSRGRLFVKRRHPRRRQPEPTIRAQHALVARLRESTFPAPATVPTTKGSPFLDLEGDVYEVWQYVEGRSYDSARPAQLEAAAETLAWYHSCVQDFEPASFRDAGPLYSPAQTRSELDRLSQAWQLDQDPGLSRASHRLASRIDALAVHFGKHGDLPKLVIHGDYHGGNLLFAGDRVVGLVDYDKANWQPRITELAEALIYFASPRPGHMRNIVYPGFLDQGRFVRFIKVYAGALGIREREACALPDYICCIWLFWSLRRSLERAAHRPENASPALQETLALGTWASINRDRIIQIALRSQNTI
jgi:homoserine kinase type II